MKINKNFFIYIVSFVLGALTLVSCSEQDTTSASIEDNFVSLEALKRVVLPVDETQTFDFNVYASAAHSTDRTYNLVVDTDNTDLNSLYYSVPVSVTIPANSKTGTFQVSITGTDLGTGKDLVLSLEPVAGTDIGKTLTIKVKELCEENLVALDLVFDNYPEESYWEIYDSAFNLIAYTEAGDYAGLEQTSEEFCLSSGDYYFVMYDYYGDGMYDGSNTGTYNLIFLSPISSIPLASGEGNFGSYEVTPFTID